MFAHEGAKIVPLAQIFVCKYFLQLKIKLFSVIIKSKNVITTSSKWFV